MSKNILVMLLLFSITGCGAADRISANFTGDASETCHKGVLYLQFTSGASVAYNTNGSIKTCKE